MLLPRINPSVFQPQPKNAPDGESRDALMQVATGIRHFFCASRAKPNGSQAETPRCKLVVNVHIFRPHCQGNGEMVRFLNLMYCRRTIGMGWCTLKTSRKKCWVTGVSCSTRFACHHSQKLWWVGRAPFK